MLLLHGGPGVATSAYFSGLEKGLVELGYPVVRYDQLGCGHSERPGDPRIWTLELFLDELAAIRRQFDLEEVSVLGHSWGGILALEHVLSGAQGVRRLILASSPVSSTLWTQHTRRLREQLPARTLRVIERLERTHRPPAEQNRKGPFRDRKGVSDRRIRMLAPALRWGFQLLMLTNPQWLATASAWTKIRSLEAVAWQIAQVRYVASHIYRSAHSAPPVEFFAAGVGWNPVVYEVMWGPSEFVVDGCLAGWEVLSRLHEIEVPTLITSGRFDEATPQQMKLLQEGIAGSQWVMFDHSAHMAHMEEPERYLEVIGEFLARNG